MKYLIALTISAFLAVCGVAGTILGLALRAVNRAFDSAVTTATVVYVLKYMRVF
jgi:hypothetical protein